MKTKKRTLALLLALVLCLSAMPLSASAELSENWKYNTTWSIYDANDEVVGFGYLVEVEGELLLWSDAEGDGLYAQNYKEERSYPLEQVYTLSYDLSILHGEASALFLYAAANDDFPEKYAYHFRLPDCFDDVKIQYVAKQVGNMTADYWVTASRHDIKDTKIEDRQYGYYLLNPDDDRIEPSSMINSINFINTVFLDDGSFCGVFVSLGEEKSYDVMITIDVEDVLEALAD